jgi:hypothetical protein
MKKLLPFLCLFGAVSAVCLFSLGQVAWGTNCSWIMWDGNQPTCDDDPASGNPSFFFDLDTSTYSDFNSSPPLDYTMYTVFTLYNSPNIAEDGASVSPETHDVYMTGAFPSECEGHLENDDENGTFQVSAYDSPYAYCSGAWDVDIIKHPNRCP